ncbi:MAG: DUF2059 domain-containing protein, partial [Candidatus Omnitrophica bacterium]|nr:DUF2059 domain-containing protein [Candidatus Omnitrophota bacterium]
MFRKMTGTAVILLLFTFSFAMKIDAQEIISQEKRALIKELLEVAKVAQMTENMTDTMLLQMERNYPQMISQVMSEAELLKGREQDELQKELIESQLRFSMRFRELYPQRVDMEQVIEEVYYPLYDKYFTESELKDIIVFHKSPAGKKFIEVAPQLFQESMQKFAELLNPKIMQLIDKIMQEEKEHL